MGDRSGEIVRDYELLQLLGEGAFAAVYRAVNSEIKQPVAIKIIHPHHLSDEDSMHRFKDEANLIAHLDHPHIVSFKHFWIDDDGAYIVMRWVDGGSLRKYMDRGGTVLPDQASKLLSQIAPALSLVHRKQIIHRDLKPDNILMDREGNAHIADFGLAKWQRDDNQRTRGSEIIGTPAYMPPEQAEGDSGSITGRADIYSLGILLFEILTGQHPFGKAETVPMILHHLRDPLPSMRDIIPTLPEALDLVIQKATAKKPEDRFHDPLEFAQAFQSAITIRHTAQFLEETITLTPVVQSAGDLHARLYKKSGAVLEKPRRLLGREDVLESVQNWIDEEERVLIHGLAGIGKTSIAGALAAKYIEDGKGDVIWIELGKQNADTLFEALARAFGQHQAIVGKQGDERIAAVRELLLEQEAMLVIDNVWKESAMLSVMRAIPHTMPTIITSRLSLSIDGIMIDVEALEPQAALDLLSYHAKQNYGEDPAAEALCKLFGNHPYAIELSGKQLQVYRHLNPDRLAHEIEDAPHKLVNTGALGVGQQRSVKDLLDESVDELPAHLRRLFRLMGGLSSTHASLDLFSRIAETESWETDLADLDRNGLIRLVYEDDQLPHYRLHDLTYSYANTIFRQEIGDKSDIITAVRAFVSDHATDYDELDFELVNILAGAKAAYRKGDKDGLINIMRRLTVDAEYLTARGASSAALELTRAAIKSAEQCGDFEAAHYMVAKLGNVYFQINAQYALAVETYSEALRFARKMKNLSREAICLSLVATARFQAGMDKVEDFYERASNVARQSSDPKTMAQIFNHRSFHAVYKQPPDYIVGREFCDLAIQICQQYDLNEYLISTLQNRATCETSLGNHKEALQSDLEAYHVAVETNNHMWIARLSEMVGKDYHALGDRSKAIIFLRNGYKLAMNSGDKITVKDIEYFSVQHHYDLIGG